MKKRPAGLQTGGAFLSWLSGEKRLTASDPDVGA
jgi:hypothetical protein